MLKDFSTLLWWDLYFYYFAGRGEIIPCESVSYLCASVALCLSSRSRCSFSSKFSFMRFTWLSSRVSRSAFSCHFLLESLLHKENKHLLKKQPQGNENKQLTKIWLHFGSSIIPIFYTIGWCQIYFRDFRWMNPHGWFGLINQFSSLWKNDIKSVWIWHFISLLFV